MSRTKPQSMTGASEQCLAEPWLCSLLLFGMQLEEERRGPFLSQPGGHQQPCVGANMVRRWWEVGALSFCPGRKRGRRKLSTMAHYCRHLSHSFTLNFRSIPRAAYFQMMLPRKSKQCQAVTIYLTMNHSLKNYQLWKAFTTLGIMQWCVSCESVQSVSMATPTQSFANSWGNLPGRVAENKPAYCGFSKEK